MKYCTQCGNTLLDQAIVCPKCGCANPGSLDVCPVGMKDKWVTAALAFFLGTFGAHKFYENKISMGILYIILTFFSFGLWGIVPLVESVVILTKNERYYIP